jgi:hypothetical protein
MTPSEVIDDETAQQKRDLSRSAAFFYCSMRDIDINTSTVSYFEETMPVEGHGYAHLFGWALGGE